MLPFGFHQWQWVSLFSPPEGAKDEDIRFMTLTCHASCLNLPWQTNSQRDLDAWTRLYIKLSTDTDKDFVKLDVFRDWFPEFITVTISKGKKAMCPIWPSWPFQSRQIDKNRGNGAMAYYRLNTGGVILFWSKAIIRHIK